MLESNAADSLIRHPVTSPDSAAGSSKSSQHKDEVAGFLKGPSSANKQASQARGNSAQSIQQ